jgi:hypothetical protein
VDARLGWPSESAAASPIARRQLAVRAAVVADTHLRSGWMRRLVLVPFTAAALLALALGAAPASADPANRNTLSLTLDCGGSGTFDAVFELSSADSFHLVSTSSNFVWKSLSYVTSTGETGQIDRGIQGGDHGDLVTCTYTGPSSGNAYVVTGFFTP